MKHGNLNYSETVNSDLGAVSGSFYKCVADDYYTYHKGKIYSSESIGKYLIDNPKDWKKVLPYPTTKELLAALEKNERVSQVIKSLKQWQNCR